MTGNVRNLLLALSPFAFGMLSAMGVNFSEDIKATIIDNLSMVFVGLGVLGTLVPGIRAAIRAASEPKEPE